MALRELEGFVVDILAGKKKVAVAHCLTYDIHTEVSDLLTKMYRNGIMREALVILPTTLECKRSKEFFHSRTGYYPVVVEQRDAYKELRCSCKYDLVVSLTSSVLNDSLIEKIESYGSECDSQILLTSVPCRSVGRFYTIFKNKEFDSLHNIADNWLDSNFVREIRASYGEGSTVFNNVVLGEF